MGTVHTLRGRDNPLGFKLDKRDEKLLAILAEDARTPVSIIARTLGINRDTVKYKMKRLEECGIIKRYHLTVDLERFGYMICHVFLLMEEMNVDKRAQLIGDFLKHPNTISVLEYNDTWDIEWVFIAKNIKEYDEIISEVTRKYLDNIIERDTLISIREFHTTILPFELNKPRSHRNDTSNQAVKINEKDTKILSLLNQNSRMNAVDIAGTIHLSADAVIKRIKHLKQEGIIQEFTIQCDRSKMNYQWYSLAIRMKHFGKKEQEKLKILVREHPHIVHCVKTAGLWDIYLYVCAKEVTHFHQTVKMMKKEFADTVLQCDSWLLYKDHGFNNFPPVISQNKKSE